MYQSVVSQSKPLLLSLLLGLAATALQADSTTSYTYTSQGQIATVDGPRTDVADITTYGYDAQGNRNLIRNALGQETRTSAHDGAGRPLTIVDPNGLTTQLGYDPRGRLTSLELSDGATTRTTGYAYDPAGNLIQATSADGSVLTLDYDSADRLIGLQDGEGNRIELTLDTMGNRLETRVNDTAGTLRYRQQQVYNQLGRLIQTLDAQNHTTGYEYDAQGNLKQTTNARQHTTQQTYDALERLNQTTDALNGTTHYTYDAQNNLTGVTDPKGLTTAYEYDALGNLMWVSDPRSPADMSLGTYYTYDQLSRPYAVTGAAADGQHGRPVTVYLYDDFGQLDKLLSPNSASAAQLSCPGATSCASHVKGMPEKRQPA